MSQTAIAGVDEVGRGTLAGSVVCAAVILRNDDPCIGEYRDSKKLSAKRRLSLYHHIRQHALAYAISQQPPMVIDDINILQATLLGMRQAVLSLPVQPAHVLVDGNTLPSLPMSAEAIIGGDDQAPEIAAASIVAKVVRDRLMGLMDVRYPGYGFAIHKGYATRAHKQALQMLGVSPVHRRSFAPVAAQLRQQELIQ